MSARNELLARVAGAQGMVIEQAECSEDDALALIVDRALEDHETVGAIADAVLDRSIRLGCPTRRGGSPTRSPRRWLPDPLDRRRRRVRFG
jgi:hypothetical protein